MIMEKEMNLNETVLSVKGLKKKFGDLEVLRGLDLDVRNGEQIAIIGPSGCGKSTFLRCINCMEDPTDGVIMFEGENLADMKVDINVHRQKIGMVFQQFNLFNNKTVIENIMLAPIYVGVKNLKAAKRKNLFTKLLNLFAKEKKALLPVETTKNVLDLLKFAHHNEYEEHQPVYPSFAETARKEGFPEIATSFELIARIEKTHGDRFKMFAELLEQGKLFVSECETEWMCLNCGHIHTGKSAPGICPVCHHEQGYFIRAQQTIGA